MTRTVEEISSKKAASSNWQSDKERLEQDIRAVIDDAQALLGDARSEVEMHGGVVQEGFQRRIDQLRERAAAAQGMLRDQARTVVKVTDRYVHENPWPAIGMAATVGLVVGFMAGRRE